MHVSLLSWQNQLLVKGLLFIEEKVKLCEGKYSKKPILKGSCFLLFGQTRWFACLESIQPFLVLSQDVIQPFGNWIALQPLWGLRYGAGCLNGQVTATLPPATFSLRAQECAFESWTNRLCVILKKKTITWAENKSFRKEVDHTWNSVQTTGIWMLVTPEPVGKSQCVAATLSVGCVGS